MTEEPQNSRLGISLTIDLIRCLFRGKGSEFWWGPGTWLVSSYTEMGPDSGLRILNPSIALRTGAAGSHQDPEKLDCVSYNCALFCGLIML